MNTSLAEKMYNIYQKQGLIDSNITKEQWIEKETAKQSKLKAEVNKSGFKY